MAVRVTYLAIALGGVCGTFAALVGSSTPTPRAATPSLAPSGNAPPQPSSQLAAPPGLARPAPIAPASAPSSSSPSPSATQSAAPTASASAASLQPITSPDLTPPPSSKAALLRAEMHCDQRDAAACILAARSYEAGSSGASDADKAVKYRKIALTLWISQCDRNSAPACATLTDMYRAGNGVPQSDRNADALLARTRELCHYNDAPVCHQLPAP
jgi:TPR repeat protein